MTAEHASRTVPLPEARPDAPLLSPPGGRACDEHLVDYWLDVSAEVSRIQQHLDRTVERSGIAAQWAAVLHLLLRADEHRLPMTVLARHLSMTSGGFSKLADRMVTAGLIARRGSAADRRVVNALLSVQGLALAKQTARTYREALRNCLRDDAFAEDQHGEGQCSCAGRCLRPMT